MTTASAETSAAQSLPPIRVGIIGVGLSARVFHAPLVTSSPRFRLAAAVERKSPPTSPTVFGVPDLKIHTTVPDLLADASIELVIVATANDTHFSFARDALLAGKHVIVEKPFAISETDARELVAVSRKANRVLAVFQNRRWDGDFLTIKKVIGTGMLGEVIEYEAHYDRYRPCLKGSWREHHAPGSGILYDLGSHLIDQALTLFGPPATVTANVMCQRVRPPPGTSVQDLADDAFDVWMNYDSGLRVVLKAGCLVREIGPRYIIHGRSGSFIKHGLDVQEPQLAAGQRPTNAFPDFGMEPADQYGLLNTEIDSSDGGILAAAIAATATGFPLSFNGIDSLPKSAAAADGPSTVHFRGRVETLPGNYLAFYENVADAIIAAAAQSGTDLAAELLEVKPEQAANVIRVIELARRSCAEGKTLAF